MLFPIDGRDVFGTSPSNAVNSRDLIVPDKLYKGIVAITETDLALDPPEPEQLKEKVYEPAGVIVNAVLPEVAFVPSQDPLAEQEVALVLDQVIVATSPATNSVEDMLKVVTGATRAGGAGAGALPPPPPPPHPNKKINAKK
tara:strand:- start:139 stop:564 length:426 start_codon:yes stop_codon:yes gene_type:complete